MNMECNNFLYSLPAQLGFCSGGRGSVSPNVNFVPKHNAIGRRAKRRGLTHWTKRKELSRYGNFVLVKCSKYMRNNVWPQNEIIYNALRKIVKTVLHR